VTSLLSARGVEGWIGGRPIIGPLDLEVAAGEHVAVVGPNGAGKTTLLRLLAGLLSPKAGALMIHDRPYRSLGRRELARRVAYVPQLRPLSVPLIVEEVVLLGRYPHLGRFQLSPAPRDFEVVSEALERVEIGHLRRRRVGELSGGERQAVYIAAALAQEAEVLVLDEPTAHLDPRHQRDVASLLARLRREGGRAVILATHDLNLASLVADRVVAVKNGRCLAEGPPRDLLAPSALTRLFDAPFELVRGGERPVTLLELTP
jgi:iron complex transport system ATP-binding protein